MSSSFSTFGYQALGAFLEMKEFQKNKFVVGPDGRNGEHTDLDLSDEVIAILTVAAMARENCSIIEDKLLDLKKK